MSMDEHLIFYIDLLGTRDAIKSSDKGTTNALIKLLSYVASLRGEFDLSAGTEEELIVSKIRPAVSTFSDHIVISYPVEELRQVDERDGLGRGLYLTQEGIVAYLAAAAVLSGFLIRGGAAVGPLYHAGGVVLWAAMVEAYELESHYAIYPRIAVSPKLDSLVRFEPRTHVLLKDHDGITHLNYFTSMVLRSSEIEDTRAAWLTRARRAVEENIKRFEREERLNELAKWVWFGKQLEQACANAAPLIM
jgi:hypothetical protein